MTREQPIDLQPEHRRLVLGIIRARLPAETEAWVFGSPATGRAWRYSDLDLALDAGRPLTPDDLAILAEAFRESDLPYTVDLVDWRSIGDRFRRIIAGQRVVLTEDAASTRAAP